MKSLRALTDCVDDDRMIESVPPWRETFKGELSKSTAKQVLGGRLSRLPQYKAVARNLMKKYKGYEINFSGHSYGAANLIEMLSDGTIDPGQIGYAVALNSPMLRNKHWKRKADEVFNGKHKNIWNIHCSSPYPTSLQTKTMAVADTRSFVALHSSCSCFVYFLICVFA